MKWFTKDNYSILLFVICIREKYRRNSKKRFTTVGTGPIL